MPSGLMRSLYSLNGGVVAQRESTLLSSTLVYLHSDHLGSVSMATSSIGGVVSSQEYDPWGVIISGGVGQTTINYTGQRLDATGLLYYHARYYDPSLGKFLTPDSIVPGASIGAGGALGTVGDEQNSKLTVDFHESGFVSSVNGENQQILSKGFWFQLSGQDKQRSKSPCGPGNPQALNRYSYALNNALRFNDPTGHTWYLSKADAQALSAGLRIIAQSTRDFAKGTGTVSAIIGALTTYLSISPGLSRAIAQFLTTLAGRIVGELVGAVGFTAFLVWMGANALADRIDQMADLIDQNTGEDGVAIAAEGTTMYFMNRSTGVYTTWSGVAPLIMWNLPADMGLGKGTRTSNNGPGWLSRWHFAADDVGIVPPNSPFRFPGRQ